MGKKRVDGMCDAVAGYVPALCDASRIARRMECCRTKEVFQRSGRCSRVRQFPRATDVVVGVPDHGRECGI